MNWGKTKEFIKFIFNILISFIIFAILQVALILMLNDLYQNILINIQLFEKIGYNNFNIIANCISMIMSLGIASFYLISKTDKEEKENINNKKAFEYVFTSIGVIGIIRIFLKYIYGKIGLDYNISNNESTYIFNILKLLIIAPVFEELFFRKAILNYSKKYGKVFAVIFSAVLFAIYHLNVSQGIFAFLMGILFGIITIKTGNIKMSIFLHFLNNLYTLLQIILTGVFLDLFNVVFFSVFIFGVIMLVRNILKH